MRSENAHVWAFSRELLTPVDSYVIIIPYVVFSIFSGSRTFALGELLSRIAAEQGAISKFEISKSGAFGWCVRKEEE
jgi:hypothetical protein